MEAEFNLGMRYLWDTGVRWEPIGTIEASVFKDLNSDGLRQRDEAPVEGVKLWLGKDKWQITDIFGRVQFSKVKAKKAYVNLDVGTLPLGFVPTVPVVQEVKITHRGRTSLNFGIISRSEITGLIFYVYDGDGKFGRNDQGVEGVVLTLEDGTSTATYSSGRYFFRNVPAGKHTVTLD